MSAKIKRFVNSSPAPEITYIVSAFNRPVMLPVCLWSIKGQTHQDLEVIVTDNSEDPATVKLHKQAIVDLKDKRFTHLSTARKIKVSDPYWSAEYAIKTLARGRWLAFPCDDTYLMPQFAERMLRHAQRERSDFVWCRWPVVGQEAAGNQVHPDVGYGVWDIKLHRTPKTSFIVRRSVFKGFAGKLDRAGYCNADYFLSSQMAQDGVRMSCLSDTLLVHN